MNWRPLKLKVYRRWLSTIRILITYQCYNSVHRPHPEINRILLIFFVAIVRLPSKANYVNEYSSRFQPRTFQCPSKTTIFCLCTFICFHFWFVDYYELYDRSSIAAQIWKEEFENIDKSGESISSSLGRRKIEQETADNNNLSWKWDRKSKRKNAGFIIYGVCWFCVRCAKISFQRRRMTIHKTNSINHLSSQFWAPLFSPYWCHRWRWCFSSIL